MFETSVVRYVRLLLQSLQQTDLSLRPLIEQAEAGRTITYIDTGQISGLPSVAFAAGTPNDRRD